jgi:hypothetical protein
MSFSVLIIVGLLILAIGFLVWAMRGSTATITRVNHDTAFVTPSRISASALEVLSEPPPAAITGHITWPALLDEHDADLSVERRYELVQRLGVIADDWTTPILRQAVHEEQDPRILDAVVDALVAKKLR